MDSLFGIPLGLWGWLLVVVSCFVSEWDAKRRIRESLKASDAMWNELLIKHQKAIAEAYMDGKPFQIDIQRS